MRHAPSRERQNETRQECPPAQPEAAPRGTSAGDWWFARCSAPALKSRNQGSVSTGDRDSERPSAKSRFDNWSGKVTFGQPQSSSLMPYLASARRFHVTHISVTFARWLNMATHGSLSCSKSGHRVAMNNIRRWTTALAVGLLLSSVSGHSYSVLTHEQVVDLLWKDQITPLLLRRFPDTSA